MTGGAKQFNQLWISVKPSIFYATQQKLCCAYPMFWSYTAYNLFWEFIWLSLSLSASFQSSATLLDLDHGVIKVLLRCL